MRMSRRIAVSNGVKRFWVFDGSNGGFKLAGGYDGQRYTLTSTQIKFETVSASTSVSRWYPNAAVNLTNYRKLCFIVTSATSGTTTLSYRRGGVANATNTTPTTYKTIAQNITSATKYEVDVSSLTGNHYINFWMQPKTDATSGASTTIVTQIWLE